MVMVKDNHLAAYPEPLRDRVAHFRREHPGIKVEVEADTLDQVRAFIAIPGIDIILLDNMNPAQMREAVDLRGAAAVKIEASGGVTLATVREIALTGVDFISIGALTHSAGSIDFSLEFANGIKTNRGERRWTRISEEIRVHPVHPRFKN